MPPLTFGFRALESYRAAVVKVGHLTIPFPIHTCNIIYLILHYHTMVLQCIAANQYHRYCTIYGYPTVPHVSCVRPARWTWQFTTSVAKMAGRLMYIHMLPLGAVRGCPTLARFLVPKKMVSQGATIRVSRPRDSHH